MKQEIKQIVSCPELYAAFKDGEKMFYDRVVCLALNENEGETWVSGLILMDNSIGDPEGVSNFDGYVNTLPEESPETDRHQAGDKALK
jgi:hypothetical protein